jgi:membrane fusion protein, multidrug efflux system
MALGRKSKVVLALLGIGITVLVFGVELKSRGFLHRWDPDEARKHKMPIPVRTVTVSEGKLEETVGATAVTVPAESATIRIVQGSSVRELLAVHVRLGSEVKKGDTMFEFKPDVFQQAVQQRKAALGAAEEAYNATKRLHTDKAASGFDLSDALVKVETAKLDLVMAQQDLKDCVVTAPIDGIVADVQTVPGEKIDTTVDVTQVHRLDPILVQMDFPEERIDALSIGQRAEVVLDSFPHETFVGKVVRISPVADTETRVLPVMVEVSNSDHRIKAGLTGFVRIKAVTHGQSIPGAALIREGGRAMAFRVVDGRAVSQVVKPGPLMKDGMVQILEGLETGAEVVLFGNFTLRDNDAVDTNWQSWALR